jgi:hypothetical protein
MAKNVGGYNDLIDLFIEFRDLIKPNVKNGVPDFTKSAMEKQFDNLKILQDRLSKIDFYSWNIKQKVDYYVLRSEMNGVEFDHRVLKQWSRDPGFLTFQMEFIPDFLVHHSKKLFKLGFV